MVYNQCRFLHFFSQIELFSLSRFNVRNPAYHETHSNDEQNRLPIQIMVVFFHNRVS